MICVILNNILVATEQQICPSDTADLDKHEEAMTEENSLNRVI